MGNELVDGLHAHALTPFEAIELRRYAMHPGKRDDLIAIFEQDFIETQEAAGMVPIGHFRDLDDPDAFVWLRGFATMDTRRRGLETFYTSQTWLDRRVAANATMADSDNVLLLRDARSGSGIDLRGLRRPNGTAPRGDDRFVALVVLMLERGAGEEFLTAFEGELLPALRAASHRLGYYVTQERPNDFPRLPVRESEHAFVCAAVCDTREGMDAWLADCEPGRLPHLMRERVVTSEFHRLAPAARSLLR